MANSVDEQNGSLVLDLVMTIILPAAGGGTVLLLLLGYYLWRRLHGKTRKQGDVHGFTEGTPVDLFAGVRARRSSATQVAEAVQTADALRRLSAGGESIVSIRV